MKCCGKENSNKKNKNKKIFILKKGKTTKRKNEISICNTPKKQAEERNKEHKAEITHD